VRSDAGQLSSVTTWREGQTRDTTRVDATNDIAWRVRRRSADHWRTRPVDGADLVGDKRMP